MWPQYSQVAETSSDLNGKGREKGSGKAVYNRKPEQRQRAGRTMIGVLVPALLLTAAQAMAQLTSEGNQYLGRVHR